MTGKEQQDWMTLSMEAWMLGAEVSMVIWLRTMRMAMGGRLAEAELEKMMREKIAANLAFGAKLASGQAGKSAKAITGSALSHYGGKVRANRKRLTGRG